MQKETRIEGSLRKLAGIQQARWPAFILASLVFTGFAAIGLGNVRMETDIAKQFPSDMESLRLQERANEKFGEAENVFLLVKLDSDPRFSGTPRDIRDPSVMRMVTGLTERLRKESEITRAFSAGDIFAAAGVPDTIEGVKSILQAVPGSESLFSRGFDATTIVMFANIGTAEEEVIRLEQAVRRAMLSVERPAGIEILVTGSASIRMDILSAFRSDSVTTMAYAGIIILALLLAVQRSKYRTFITFFPMTFSLIWTYGTLGWLDIPISFATAALGSIILGLGVEYGIFYVKRYEEGLKSGFKTAEALSNASAGIGSAIIGSGATTIIGFMALALVDFPMIQQLGVSLSLSIFYSLVAVLIVNPAFIMALEITRTLRFGQLGRPHG